MQGKRIDRTGFKTKFLTVLRGVGKNKHGHVMWECLCACGNTSVVASHNLTANEKTQTQSCGCQTVKSVVERSTTHGKTKTKEFASWSCMKQRCSSESEDKVKYYGDVEIQPEWEVSFQAFLDHIGPQPNDGQKYTIERILNSKGYVEGNVQWKTQTYQARNKGLQRGSRTGFNGVTLAITNRRGWPELRYVAVTYGIDGKRIAKCFSVRKYGIIPAFAKACAARNEMIKQLNAQGAGYSDKHGK